jgi:DNA primase
MSVWEDVKEKLNLVEVISEYTPVKMVGNSYKCVCPFHNDKNPSLVISPEKGLWHCFGCGAGGDIFRFVMDYDRIDKKEALERLARKANINLEIYQKLELKTPETQQKIAEKISYKDLGYKYMDWAAEVYHKVLLKILNDTGHPVTEYCRARHLNIETIKKFKLGFALKGDFLLNLAKKYQLDLQILQDTGLLKQKNNVLKDVFKERLTVPIFDENAKIVAFTGRNLPSDKSERPKYLNSKESLWFKKSEIWYGLNLAKSHIRKEKKAIVVEGNMDVIAAHNHNLENCVASQGTAVTVDHFKKIKYFTDTIWLAFDNDEAGQTASKKFFKQASSYGIQVFKVLISEKYKDLDELLQNSEEKLQVKFYLDYIIAKLNLDLQSSDLQIQKASILNILDLLSTVDDLTKEHYLSQLVNLTKKNRNTLENYLNNIIKNNTKFETTEIKSELKPVENTNSKKIILDFQNFLAYNLNLVDFQLMEMPQLEYFQTLFKLLNSLTKFSELETLEEYFLQEYEMLKLISENLIIDFTDLNNQINIKNRFIIFLDNNFLQISLDQELQAIYTNFKHENLRKI